jgi:hypothetical protein
LRAPSTRLLNAVFLMSTSVGPAVSASLAKRLSFKTENSLRRRGKEVGKKVGRRCFAVSVEHPHVLPRRRGEC